jgi:hypothetical protein
MKPELPALKFLEFLYYFLKLLLTVAQAAELHINY